MSPVSCNLKVTTFRSQDSRNASRLEDAASVPYGFACRALAQLVCVHRDCFSDSRLFTSESLQTLHGTYFDQRFVDYLSRDFGSIDKINWRKFEGLTCEFFNKLGFHVEIGKGRDDDNVDARIWRVAQDAMWPPLILVQCKREKQEVGKVVVKALYADMTEENAESGLIVTTSALSPGARKVCKARSYPINEANRETLKIWVEIMRTPYTGVFLGE
jgi:restriction system protein